MSSNSVKRGFHYTLFLVVVTIAMFLVLNYVFVFARNWKYQDDNDDAPGMETSTANVFSPYVHWRHEPHSGPLLNVNQHGERSTWNPPDIDTGGDHYEIFVYGGSTIRGSGVADHETVPSQISKSLAKHGLRNVVVRNMGQSSYTNTQESVQFLLNLQEGEKPDLVLFYDGVNEVYSTMLGGSPGDPGQVSQLRAAHEHYGTVMEWPFIRAFFLDAPIVEWTARRVIRRQLFVPGIGKKPEELYQNVLARYSSNLEVINQIAAAMGIEAVFVWQPCLFSKKNTALAEEVIMDETKFGGFLSELYLLCTKNVGSHINERGLSDRFVDLSDVLGDTRDALYSDYMHVNEEGNRIIGRAIARIVEHRINN